MLIVPLAGKISWRRPPVATIWLVLVNCFVFFAFQAAPDDAFMAAEDFYRSSGLARIELPRYLEYLKTGASSAALPDLKELDETRTALLHWQMEADADFMARLRRGRVIAETEAVHAEWQGLRKEYEDRLGETFDFRYGFIPARQAPFPFLSYMFLHGSFGHLLGNMVFLWLVGCVLEAGCGPLVYILGYLAGGVGAALFYGQFNLESHLPLIGASGAVSGLMGALPVFYGRNRVKVFYSLGFYFDTIKVPALVLLPLWIGKEVAAEFWLDQESNVAYMAHVGGLLAGALLALVHVRWIGPADDQAFQGEKEDEIAPLMERAYERLSALDLAGAREAAEGVLARDPDHADALALLFRAWKEAPHDTGFHRSAERLLGRLCRSSVDHPEACEVFRDYLAHARPPSLAPETALRLGNACCGLGDLELAEEALKALFRHSPRHPGLPPLLLRLAELCREKGRQRRAGQYRELLCRRFPAAAEARLIRSSPDSS